jgi:DGQHR domain-containing protein
MSDDVIIHCLTGVSAHRRVLIGFAPAATLYKYSFADILNEDTNKGYQRPFNERHSQDFRRYIKGADSATIPLTLNLRPTDKGDWRIVEGPGDSAELIISASAVKIMAQVDCQHRLGHLGDLPIVLPFMCFVGLTEHEEMEIFSVINSKAKGLSPSLLDYHDAHLTQDLASERPELFVALRLNNDEESPWLRRLNLGGKTTVGLKRLASLRLMQQAVGDFLKATKVSPDEGYRLVLDFWKAVTAVLPAQWKDPRRHMLVKGVGVYALMHIAADIYLELNKTGALCDRRAYATALIDFAELIDWTTTGPLKGFGGQAGVKAAVEYIRENRKRARYKVVNG